MTERIDAALDMAEALHWWGAGLDGPMDSLAMDDTCGYLAAIRALRDIAGNHTADNQPRCKCIDCEPAWRVLGAFADAVEGV